MISRRLGSSIAISSASSVIPRSVPRYSELSTSVLKPDLVRYQIRDPLAFLIESERLSRSEIVWQRIFAIVPWLVFPAFVVTPLLIASCKASCKASGKASCSAS